MALLLLDAATMTTNFLQSQTSSSLFFILPQECFHKGTPPKALPMLPSRSSRPRRRPVIPQPSPSQIAMQKKGLELTPTSRKNSPADHIYPIEYPYIIMPEFTNNTPMSPKEAQPERTSSVYSTESAHSTDSTETTISQIVEMYTDLINKIPRFEPSEVNILQPRAYRDTVAPLLQRRFSADNQVSYHTTLPSTQVSHSTDSHAGLLPKAPRKKAPGFQEFSQNLRDRRAEITSPLSVVSSDHAQRLTLDSLSTSPAMPRMRPFSFASDSPANVKEQRSVSPLAPEDLSQTPKPQSEHKMLDAAFSPTQHLVSDQRQDSQKSLRYIHSKDIFDLGHQKKSEHSMDIAQSANHRHNSDRFYRNRSTGSASTDSFVIYTGLGETMKAMIKEKMGRRKKAKEVADIMISASQKYPVMEIELRKQSKEQRRSSLTNGVNSLIRKASLKVSVADNSASASPEPRKTSAAIPLTPYQKYGAEVWTAKNKKKRKEERQKEREAQLDKEISISATQDHKHTHKRTASTKTSSTTASNTSHGKKNSLMVVFEGARNSLIHTSAEKRREKLKESIVLVGPAQLSYANVSVSGGVPS